MKSSDIDTVMVNGKILVENGKAVTIDEEDVLRKAKTWQQKIHKG
jgi:hypothetical protein